MTARRQLNFHGGWEAAARSPLLDRLSEGCGDLMTMDLKLLSVTEMAEKGLEVEDKEFPQLWFKGFSTSQQGHRTRVEGARC